MKIHWLVEKLDNTYSKYPDELFSSGNKAYTCLNSYSYNLLRKDPEVFKSVDGITLDGLTMCLALKALWRRNYKRLSFDMTGLAADLFEKLNSENSEHSVYFIGAKQEQIESTIHQISKSYPNMKIAGFRNGYFNEEIDSVKAIMDIVNSGASFCIVGMGTPVQEKFVVNLRDAGFEGICFTCGGFLHQTSGSINYYPDWVNRYNLRAFYRLFHEKGLWKRLWKIIVVFPVNITVDTLHSKLTKQ